jgi:hypothetical protein
MSKLAIFEILREFYVTVLLPSYCKSNTLMNKNTILFLTLFGTLLIGCKPDEDKPTNQQPAPTQSITPPENFRGLFFSLNGTLNLSFQHTFGNSTFQLAPTQFITNANDTLVFTDLVYYVSHIRLTRADGSILNLQNNHLLNHQTGRTSFTVNVPQGHYTKLDLLLGVDSVNNHSGMQEGDLDPANGMFWTWNTGYIFYRIKGRHGTANTAFVYDVGGLQNLVNISIDLNAYQVNKTAISCTLKHDVAAFFNTPNMLNLRQITNQVHTATSPILPTITANMRQMITIQSIQ